MAFLCEHYLLSDILPMAKVIAGMVGVAELKSAMENGALLTQSPLLLKIEAVLGNKLKEVNQIESADDQGPSNGAPPSA